jgi:uncharacterized repeat protein (TIGR01451 family)
MTKRSRTLTLFAATAAILLISVPGALAATFTVTNTADLGAGSLRQAITEANGAPGSTIEFNIPGPGPFTISPASALPSINGAGTTIDGCSQPGSDCSGLPLTLEVRIAGRGLPVHANGVTIKGLSITGTGTLATEGTGAGAISIGLIGGNVSLAENVTIVDNYIGLAPDGSAAGDGLAVRVQANVRNHHLAGLHIIDNVIGANAGSGIEAETKTFETTFAMTGTRIEGNIIGLDPTGTQPRPNGGAGILLEWTGDTRIVDNTIADNVGAGIVHRGRNQATPHSEVSLDPGTLIEGNRIEGNGREGIWLGQDETFGGGSFGKDPYSGPVTILGNTISGNGTAGAFAGIATVEAAETLRPNIEIGGLAAGEGNTISDNTGAGVAIGQGSADTSVAVTVRGNSIFANGGEKIDLGDDGPTANGPAGTIGSGPNLLTNHPTITTIVHGSIVVEGTYEGGPEATVTLDFYKSETEDGPQTWIGSKEVTTGATGKASFRAEFEPDVATGWLIEATATDAGGDTSEFDQAMVVPAPPVITTVPPATTGQSGAGSGSNAGQGGSASQTVGGSEHRHRAHHKSKPQPKPKSKGTARLSVSVTPSSHLLRPTSVLTYRITVANQGSAAARRVEVCDQLPSGQSPLASRPPAGGGATPCWNLGTLAPGAHRTVRLTAQVDALATAGSEIDRATATAGNISSSQSDAATVRIRPLAATACGSSLAGSPIGRLALRC